MALGIYVVGNLEDIAKTPLIKIGSDKAPTVNTIPFGKVQRIGTVKELGRRFVSETPAWIEDGEHGRFGYAWTDIDKQIADFRKRVKVVNETINDPSVYKRCRG